MMRSKGGGKCLGSRVEASALFSPGKLVPSPPAARCTLHKGVSHDQMMFCEHCESVYYKDCYETLVGLNETCWKCDNLLKAKDRGDIPSAG
nr:hypothetical protein [Candidatus Sigynarchaeota archaeon]